MLKTSEMGSQKTLTIANQGCHTKQEKKIVIVGTEETEACHNEGSCLVGSEALDLGSEDAHGHVAR